VTPPIPPSPPPPGTLTKVLAVAADAGTTPTVKVYNANGSFRYSFNAYDPSFTGGVRVAVGDVNGDGNADIIVAPGAGMAPLVKIYDALTGAIENQFFAYEQTFTGGVYVALGDLNGDGKADIITGTGVGGGPRVQAFDAITGATLANFFAYESTFTGGVLVGAGDVNGDGRADIVTGTGVGGGPRVRVLDGKNLGGPSIYDFFAYESSFRGGVFATVGDVDGDGKAEIITGTGVGGGPAVKVFAQSTLASNPNVPEPNALAAFFAYDLNFRGGVRVDAIDANGDGKVDIVTAPGPGLSSDVRVIDFGTLQDIYRIQAFDPSFTGGVFVGGAH
jgi:hypothetical protein